MSEIFPAPFFSVACSSIYLHRTLRPGNCIIDVVVQPHRIEDHILGRAKVD